MAEYATRADLDRLERDLTSDLRDTERILRDRDDEKERQLRSEFVAAVRESEERQHARFDQIDAHLLRQDTYIMRRRFRWATWRRDTLGLLTSGLLVALILHFLFGIG